MSQVSFERASLVEYACQIPYVYVVYIFNVLKV